jgi:tetratricopeptide (TPR) repeat protein
MHYILLLRLSARRATMLIALMSCSACSSWLASSPELYRAEELSQQERHQDAIAAYREHIEDRLTESKRPEWENPYFYLLRIGDLQLRLDDPTEALKSYEQAEEQKVEASLISDRYRAVAHWYIERDRLQEAFDLLQKYRDRDSLLFDAMLDRVGRALTEKETARPDSLPKATSPAK